MSIQSSVDAGLRQKMDRISELPAETRRHILSFLSTRDAILTSALSRTWRYDWLGIPCLNFGQDFFLQSWNLEGVRYKLACEDVPDPEDALRFLKFLDSSVISKRPNFQKLHLYIPPICSLHSRISSCLHRLIVDELEVDVIGDSIISTLSRSYYVPKCVLSSKSMTKLFIQGCNLSGISISEINLPALRELSVNHVIMDQQMVENLLASCTSVEKLCVSGCEGFHSLQISGYSKLNCLEQKGNKHLELLKINTTNLRSLCCSNCKLVLASSCHTLTHIELSGFRIEDGLDFRFCRRLSGLRLLGCSFSKEWLDQHLAQLLYLEVLEISCDSESTHLIITSAHLRSLTVRCRKLEQVKLNCPNLQDFVFCTKGNIISLSSETTLAPTYVTLQLQIIGTGDKTWDVKLVELLRQLRQSKYLSIETSIIENVIIPRPLRQKIQSPLCEFEQLKLFPSFCLSSLDVTRSIDSLLWLCPRLKTFHMMDERLAPSPLFHAQQSKTILKMLLKLNYYEPTELPQTSCGCYPSLGVNCWRHSLRNYEIIEQQGFEDDNGSLKRFLDRAVTKI